MSLGAAHATRAWRPAFPERALALAVRALLVLVLLTPLVVGLDVVYPFVTGKALYARVLIALAFPLWAALALARPAWRPPRAGLLVLLGGVWLAAAVAAAFGVSPQRSFWSHYGRMEGLLDLAHWVAFAVMAASVFRTPRDWARVLGIGLAVGAAVAGAALAQALAPDLLPLRRLGPGERPYGTLGNPGYLGAWLQATALFAGGWFAATFARRPAVRAAESRAVRGARARRGQKLLPLAARFPRAARGLAAAVAALALWGLALSGSMGASVGLVAAVATTAVLLAFAAARRRTRRALLGVLVLLAMLPASLGGVLAWRAAGDAPGQAVFGVAVLDRITGPENLAVSMGSRLDNWAAGLRAFADRPLTGWGPGNYLAASGRHAAPDSGRYQLLVPE